MSLPSSPDPDFECAWVARSAVRKRAVHRRFAIALPFALVLAAIVYPFLR